MTEKTELEDSISARKMDSPRSYRATHVIHGDWQKPRSFVSSSTFGHHVSDLPFVFSFGKSTALANKLTEMRGTVRRSGISKIYRIKKSVKMIVTPTKTGNANPRLLF